MILLDSLAHNIELERRLAELEQETENLRMCQSTDSTYSKSSAKWHHEKVPEDLANVDVTEFKHLVHSAAPLIYDTVSY
uniref:HAP1 N-terminal domain-containing protein n=1 Tax=Caenorhabditis tropicalis TaxID=1561998 RepID=A0A1I7U3G0_9PELO